MKLRFYELNFEMELSFETINSLVIESPRMFEKIVVGLFHLLEGQDDVIAIVDDSDNNISKKIIDVVDNPISFTLGGATIKKKLYNEIESDIDNSIIAEKYADIASRLVDLIDEIILSSPYDLEYDIETDIKKILDAYDLKLSSPEGLFVENFVDYLGNSHRLLDKEIYIVVNGKGFIEHDDYEYIQKTIEHEKVIVLLIDYSQYNHSVNFNEVIIDKDLCEI